MNNLARKAKNVLLWTEIITYPLVVIAATGFIYIVFVILTCSAVFPR